METELPENVRDLTGLQFGCLVVSRYSHKERYICRKQKKRFIHHWVVKCSCGAESVMISNNLKKSKGCYQCKADKIGKANTKHGLTLNPDDFCLLGVLSNAKRAMLSVDCRNYESFGAIGLVVQESWLNDEKSFVDYVKSTLGRRPSKDHLLSRIDTNKNFEEGNLCWKTRVEVNLQKKGVHHHSQRGRQTTTYKCWADVTTKNCFVDKRWLVKYGGSFDNFLQDMGVKPEGSKLDRHDRSQPHGPNNSYWKEG
jgi:hypothetical protein